MKEPIVTTGGENDDATQLPLCVNLNGALIKSDIDFELFFSVIAKSPVILLYLPVWFFKGKAYFKREISSRAALNPALLPYHEELLRYLREQKKSGRRLVLVTSAYRSYAQKISDHLQLFDETLASDEETVLDDEGKAALLQSKFGDQGFDYAASVRPDSELWRCTRKTIVVNPSPLVREALREKNKVDRVIDDGESVGRTLFRAMRPHQWLKNSLLFVPLLASHQIDNTYLVAQALLGFIVFSLCASSVYLLNDLVDLSSDRSHPRKRYRPLAAGTLPIKFATLLIPALLLAALAVSLFLPSSFLLVLGGYYFLTLLYSFWFKKVVLLDVLILATLYTIRILAGGAAVAITPSFWLLTFSMFLFFSLATIKRYTELLGLVEKNDVSAKGRDYQVIDIELLMSLGTSSGLVAVLVLALYINSNDVVQMYSRPQTIWLLCPLMFYWIGRVWLLAKRGRMHEDPVLFAIKDPASWWTAVTAVAILFAAT